MVSGASTIDGVRRREISQPGRGARRIVALLALAGLLTVPVLGGCSSEDPSAVELGSVTTETVVEVVEAPASVTAVAAADVAAGSDGVVVELGAKDGERIKAGEVLFLLDSPEAEQALAAARQADAEAAAAAQVALPAVPESQSVARLDARATRAFARAREAARRIEDKDVRRQTLAEIAAAEADYAAVRSDAERAADQLNTGIASLGRVVGSLAQAQRVQTRASLQLAEQRVAALTVRAPISGRVSLGVAAAGAPSGGAPSGALPAELAEAAAALGGAGEVGSGAQPVGALTVGSPVVAGQRLATVTDVSALSMVAEVDETDVLLVRPGLRGTAEFDALPEARYGTRVTSVDVSPTAAARGGVGYQVRLSLGSGELPDGTTAGKPRPGMSAVVSLQVRKAKDTLAVPVTAVFREPDGDAVWQVADGEITRQILTLGAQGQDFVEVVAGLSLGDQIVVRGTDQVTEGQAVEDLAEAAS